MHYVTAKITFIGKASSPPVLPLIFLSNLRIVASFTPRQRPHNNKHINRRYTQRKKNTKKLNIFLYTFHITLDKTQNPAPSRHSPGNSIHISLSHPCYNPHYITTAFPRSNAQLHNTKKSPENYIRISLPRPHHDNPRTTLTPLPQPLFLGLMPRFTTHEKIFGQLHSDFTIPPSLQVTANGQHYHY